MRRLALCILLISGTLCIQAKNDNVFKPIVDSINNLFTEMAKTTSDAKKESKNAEIILIMKDFLHNPLSFDHPIDTLKFLSCVKSDDNVIRVYTWNINYNDGSFKYFGFVQQKAGGKISIYSLDDMRNHNPNQDFGKEFNYYTTSEWYGCIYYECITKSWNSRTYYTLLGWDGADHHINRKIIEVLSFTRRGIPVFEKKMFKVDRVITSRMLFEYADRATMLLRYNAKHNIIVVDHLSPAEERFKDLHQYYGPDMSYDAFEFKGGRWIHESNIDPEIAINYQKNPIITRIKRRGVSRAF
ncbi:MAG: hypothetical protein HUK15_05985 [Bacteroidales bacterium]|nr:hypothetical protein [Bacteroidales bacterium]